MFSGFRLGHTSTMKTSALVFNENNIPNESKHVAENTYLRKLLEDMEKIHALKEKE